MVATPNKPRIPDRLTARPGVGSKQHDFEFQASAVLGLNAGVYAIHVTGAGDTKYVNEHVQWLWMQFIRKP